MDEAQKKKRHLKLYQKVLILFILIAAVILFLTQYFTVKSVSVSGCSYYNENEVKDMVTGNGRNKNALFLYIKYRYLDKNQDIPFIHGIKVDMQSRNELFVTVYEKTIIACVSYMSEYLYFDKDGIVVESSEQKIDGIPLVTGVNFREMTMYEPLAVADPGIFTEILSLSQLIDHYKLAVEKISFNMKQEVTLHADGIKILLGKSEQYDVPIAKLSKLLPEVADKKLKGTLNMVNYRDGQKIIFKRD